MNVWKLSTFALALALGTVVATGHMNVANADEQPVMEKALAQLHEVVGTLKAATEDKGGHKVKAIEHVKKAIEQVEKGIAFDNKHSGRNENKQK